MALLNLLTKAKQNIDAAFATKIPTPYVNGSPQKLAATPNLSTMNFTPYTGSTPTPFVGGSPQLNVAPEPAPASVQSAPAPIQSMEAPAAAPAPGLNEQVQTMADQQTASPYQPIFDQLDGMVAQLPTYQAGQEARLGEIGNAQNTQIMANRDSSLQGLARNNAQQMQAANTFLGARGASDSSGSDMYGYALQRAGSAAAAGIYQVAQDQMNQVSTWKSQELANLSAAIEQQKQDLAYNKLSVTQTDIDNWLAKLSQIEQQHNTYTQAINQWALNRAAAMDDANAEMGRTSNSVSAVPQWSYQTAPQVMPAYMRS
jgi:hypothetical protein